MKNKFVTFLFILLCMGFGINEINAGVQIGNGVFNEPSGTYTDYFTAPLAVSADSPNNFITGIRFSLIKTDGTTITHKDYYNVNVSGDKVIKSNGKTACNKVMYALGDCVYDHDSWSDIGGYLPVSVLTQFFTSEGMNVNFATAINSGNLSKENIFSSLFATNNIDKTKLIINRILQDSGTGKTIDNFKLSNGTYDLFIEWEPLSRIRIRSATGSNVYFSGTTYELSNLVKAYPGIQFTNANCGGSTLGAFCNFGKAIGAKLGCSVYLDPNSNMGAVVDFNIAPERKNLFNNTSYFNNNLDLNSWNNGKCTQKASEISDVAFSAKTTNGVGVIWIGEFLIDNDNPTCDDIYAKYGGKYSSISPYTKLYINNNSTFDFSEFNNYWRTTKDSTFPGIDVNWFKANCPCDEGDCGPGGNIDCTPNFNIPSCTSGDDKNLTYADTSSVLGQTEEYWNKCVFTDVGNQYRITPHKTSAPGANSYYDPNLSSKYCKVYCIENVVGNLAANNPVVLAGSHFVWGFSTINTVRTCKTNPEINWGNSTTVGSFYYDLKEANQAVVDALAQNKLKELNDSGYWQDTGQDQYAPDGCNAYWTAADIGFNHLNINSTNCNDIWFDESVQLFGCREWKCKEPTQGAHLCDVYEYKNSTSTATVSIGGYQSTKTHTDFTKCATSQPTGNPVSGGNVSAAISKVNSVLTEMDKCFTFNENVLKVQTSGIISYISEGDMYNYTGDMKTDTQTVYSDNTCNSKISVTALTNCSGSSCSSTSVKIKKCDTNMRTGNNITTLSLTGDVYRYVLKGENGKTLTSIHKSQLEGYKSGTLETNWIDIGYANFPVPYNYSKTEYKGSLNIIYSKIGHINSNEQSTAIDRILENQTGYGTYTGWSCNYTVKPDLIPDCPDDGPCPLGINVIYREIDLARPFPDIDASNRATGANWCSEDSCAWNNHVSNTYILNNRGVVGKEIYDLDPMYTFIMTPSDIIKIRKYNDKNKYSEYRGSIDGKTYDFKCVKETGRGCRSEYLTELMSMLDTANYPGTCKSERGVTDIDTKFNACRYQK